MTTIEKELIQINAVYKIELSYNANNKPVARLLKATPKGKYETEKKVKGFYFETEQKRDTWVINQVAEIHKSDAQKADYLAEKKQATQKGNDLNLVSVGDIFYHSWGYEQTNIDFYQVVTVSGKSATFQKIGASSRETGFMCGRKKAVKNSFTKDEPFKKMLKYQESGGVLVPYIRFEFGWCEKWDGRELGYSYYG